MEIAYKISPCPWQDIEFEVVRHIEGNGITVDSFWEDHILASQHYKIMTEDGQFVGFFAIHNKHMITLFHVEPIFGHLSQPLFERIKRYEQVTNAFVSTGDEQFLSHALDNFARLEKQAYFAIYTERTMVASRRQPVVLREAKSEADVALCDLAEDFFEPDNGKRILEGSAYFKVYIVENPESKELIGFGVVEYGRIDSTIASIGMYVCPNLRQHGYGATILENLKELVEGKGKVAHSGCWYYNHNSKKSMEVAGAYSKTRLFKIHF